MSIADPKRKVRLINEVVGSFARRSLFCIHRFNHMSALVSDASASPADVFISYTGQDQDLAVFAILLNGCLRKENIRTFIDMETPSGEEYRSKILDQVKRCKVFLCLLSPKYFTRSFCVDELVMALVEKREILPIIYHDLRNLNDPWAVLREKVTKLQYIARTTEHNTWKNGIVELRDKIIQKLKEKLGFLVPVTTGDDKKEEVTIRLAFDDVYFPSQAGWSLRHLSFSTTEHDDDSTAGAVICEEDYPGRWLTLHPSP